MDRFAVAGERPKHIPVILNLMTEWFAARPFEKALAELKGADIPHSPIMSMADIFADPHYRARQMIIDVPVEGLGTLSQPGVVPKLSLTPESTALAKDLKRRGWRFVGPTTVYAFMQAMGLVNDHLEGCDAYKTVARARARFKRPGGGR